MADATIDFTSVSASGQLDPGSYSWRRESVDPVAEQLLEDFAVQGFFRREVVQQAGATDAHAGGDVVERRAVVAVLGEAAARLGQDELTG